MAPRPPPGLRSLALREQRADSSSGRRHPSDRRAHALFLTPTARKLLAQAQRAADEYDADLLAGLGDDERRQLIELLQRLAEQAELVPHVHPQLRGQRRSSPRDA